MPSRGNDQVFLALVVLAAVVAIVFMPALRNGFTNWDDDKYVTANPAVQSLSPDNLVRIFTRHYVGAYVPLTIVSFALDYLFFKYHPLPYHAANILLHVLNCLLVFWFIRRFTGDTRAAFAAALFFGVHPLRVESVAWVTERKDVLYAFFFLSGLISYGYYRVRSDRRFLAATFFLFVAAVLAKPVAVILPLILFLVDYIDRRPFWKTALVEKIPFFAVSLAFGGMAIVAQKSARTLRPDKLLEFFPNLAAAARNLWFYVGKTLVPVRLSAYYPISTAVSTDRVYPFTWGLLILVLFIAAIYLLHRVNRRLVFGILFFVVSLLPVLQLVPSGQPLADRYLYVAAIGLSCLLALSLGGPRGTWKKILYILLVGVSGIFASLSWQRCKVWRDSLTLWNDVLQNYPNASVAYNNRGRVFQEQGDLSRALADFVRAIETDPRHALAFYNRGVTRFALNQYDLALSDLNQAAALDPGYYKTFNNRGLIYYLRGETGRALLDYERALALNPDYAGAYNNRGLIRQDIGQHEKAIADFDRALAIDPGFINAHINRAHSYLQLGQYDAAREDARKLLTLGFSEDPELKALLEK